MKSSATRPLGILSLAGMTALLWLAGEQPPDLTIAETEKKITVDGNLDDWEGITELPVQLLPGGATLAPSADLTVTVRFSFDAEHFFAAVRAVDDRVEFPGRTRREGDGFYLTFVDPAPGTESNRFQAFGFSQFGEEPLAVLASREMEESPFVRDVLIKITQEEKQKAIIYELAIPWKYVPSFRPFIHQKWALNLVYDDLDAGQKEVVALVPDPNYDGPKSKPRRWRACVFVPRIPDSPEFQSVLNANHFYPENEPKLSLAINAPAPQSGWQARLILTSPEGNFTSQQSLSFEQGLHVLSLPVEIERVTTGVYDLSLGLIDGRGALRYTEDKRFFLLDRKEFDAYETRLAELEKGELAGRDVIFRESLPTLAIRLLWVKEFMDTSSPFADLDSVQQWQQDIKDLFRSVDEGKPALFPTGRIVRLAYRSPTDDTLQPYSVLIPDLSERRERDRGHHESDKPVESAKPAPRKPLPVIVTLHDKGVDERSAISGLAALYYGPKIRKRAGDLIILAPTGRGLDDGYVGDSGKDILECLAHLKNLYPVDEKKIVLDGFGTAGYGAWRLGLLNPGMFKALLVRSGAVSPPKAGAGENLIDLADRAQNLRILIVHGDQDKEVPVEEIRKVVSRLQELKIAFEYIEVKGGGHGNYDRWNEIFDWLKDVLGPAN
ncbi:MAG: prolyl oligopeptidase family serine peptidase [Acidobacteriota bacterium]